MKEDEEGLTERDRARLELYTVDDIFATLSLW